MAKKHTDKDMGKEVRNLGGFRPDNQRMPAAKDIGRVIHRRVEILIIAGPRRPNDQLPLDRAQSNSPRELVSFKPYT